ncbi:hypothetical protein PAMC26510_07560 [Caballeronia sordidicola]|uniref:Uncharacterized protein n=2 Tax=Burkholderiales TaxID=80840 RepID=A0A242N2R2_CABSO|nr:hypothetical protein PAMC26510_07560 [Caballeronia sordidicola]
MAGIARAWSRDWQTYQYRQHGRHRYAFDNTYSSTRWTVHGDTRVREAVALRDY